MAGVVTQISPSVLGFATGAIAGLAAITPASGWVGPMGAMAIGFVASVVAYWEATWRKQAIGYDDALDVGAQFGTQAFAAAAAIYTAIVSFILLKIIDVVVGLRVSEEVEIGWLDLGEHGDVGYDL